ncbi:class I SAM-dependent methyltransferase [Candidatus Pacearchaeota archaeon]|nr:class I SAM-dependent methyltransferase [Candidatus Pacearchaeota archaeon]
MADKRYKSDLLRFKYINSYINGSEVLDIGSNEGHLHKLLKENNPGKNFFTLDNTGNPDFKVNIDKPKKINKKFDTLIAGEIIEHVKSPIKFIQYCKSLLKHGGRIIITTPNATGIQYLRNPGWCVYYENYRGHTQAFTIDMIKRILTDEGFRIIYSDYINAFWINNPLEYVSLILKRLRPDLIIIADKQKQLG